MKHAADWVLSQNVDTVYTGDLTNGLDTRWNADANERTHALWLHRQLVDRSGLIFDDGGTSVRKISENDSSSDVTRGGDECRCHDCDVEADSDVIGAWNMMQSEEGPMARPAALSVERGGDAPIDRTLGVDQS